jgi:hypothetical protein
MRGQPTRTLACLRLLSAAGLLSAATGTGLAETVWVEDFNTDGSIGPNPRYTVTGGFKSEPPHAPENIDGTASDQIGPIYWARSSEVSYVGVPAPTAGRRALLAWDGALTAGPGGASADTLRLIGNTIRWLARDKANATVVFSPNAAAAQGLADHLTTLGYNVTDDDGTTADTAYPGDVIVKGPGGPPSRFATARQGVLVFSAADHDDMLTSSIGTTATFEPTGGTVVASSHRWRPVCRLHSRWPTFRPTGTSWGTCCPGAPPRWRPWCE